MRCLIFTWEVNKRNQNSIENYKVCVQTLHILALMVCTLATSCSVTGESAILIVFFFQSNDFKLYCMWLELYRPWIVYDRWALYHACDSLITRSIYFWPLLSYKRWYGIFNIKYFNFITACLSVCGERASICMYENRNRIYMDRMNINGFSRAEPGRAAFELLR